jgi:hypothetical protein
LGARKIAVTTGNAKLRIRGRLGGLAWRGIFRLDDIFKSEYHDSKILKGVA